MKKKCRFCAAPFEKSPCHSLAYWRRKRFCSRKCYGKSNIGKPSPQLGRKRSPEAVKRITEANRKRGLLYRGEESPNWKGGRVGNGTGYILIYAPTHPRTRKGWPYVFEHLLVMEKKIGRFLKITERVHHLNGIKSDNRPENLVLCKNESEHQKKYHKGNQYTKGGSL